jgi:hypothetical protein
MTFASFVFEDISWRIIKSQSSFSKRILWNIYVNAEYLNNNYEFYIFNSIFSKKKKKRKEITKFFLEKNFNLYWFIKSKYYL